MKDLRDRIEMVLKKEFDGSLDEMASCMDVNRVTAFRYRNGTIRPSRRSANLLQARKGVSADWLLNGGSAEIRYDRTPSKHGSITALPLFTELVEDPANPQNVVIRATLETDRGKVAPNRYWVRLSYNKDFFCVGDYVLIQACPARPPKAPFIPDQYYVLKRSGKLVLDQLTPADLKSSEQTWILGAALAMQRDIWKDGAI